MQEKNFITCPIQLTPTVINAMYEFADIVWLLCEIISTMAVLVTRIVWLAAQILELVFAGSLGRAVLLYILCISSHPL